MHLLISGPGIVFGTRYIFRYARSTPGRLTIATDGDAPGRAAGHALATRAAVLGWRVSLLPAPEGRDWNDVLAMKGAAA